MPNEPWITTAMVVATVASLIAWIAAWRGLGKPSAASRAVERGGVIVALGVALVAFIGRALVAEAGWHPLAAHLDGLILMGAMFGAATAYLQWSGRLRGIEPFALPVLTVLFAWSICASWWTFRPFHIGTVWNVVHTISVYLALACITLAAAAGAMYLFVGGRLRRKKNPAGALRLLGRVASLESIERMMIVAASAGFLVLSLALISGLVIVSSQPNSLGERWWMAPKVIGSFVGWLALALVMHVKLAPSFRGRRAAWVSIAGFIILMIVAALAISGCSGHGQIVIGSDPSVIDASGPASTLTP